MWLQTRPADDILNINNVYFDNMVSQIYPSELQFNKAYTSDTEAAFLIIKWLVISLMYCNKLHAWWSTQSQLAALL